MNRNQLQNKPFDLKKYEENDSAWDSFIEIVTAGIKVGVFCICIYILKEVFMLANDLFFVVRTQNLDIIMLEIIPFLILVSLAGAALWIMAH